MQTNVKSVTRRLTLAAVFMAINIVLSQKQFTIAGFYLNETVICLAALLFDPFEAFAVGGFGAFLGDLVAAYPEAMITSLLTHGLQAVVISLIAHKAWKQKPVAASVIAVAVGAVIMIVGYTIGRCFYRTPEYAVASILRQTVQAALGAGLGTVLYWKSGVKKLFDRYIAGNPV